MCNFSSVINGTCERVLKSKILFSSSFLFQQLVYMVILYPFCQISKISSNPFCPHYFQIVASICIPFLIPAIKFVDKKLKHGDYDELTSLHSNEEDMSEELEGQLVSKDSHEIMTPSKVAPVPESKSKILKHKFKHVTLFGSSQDESGAINLFRAIFYFYTAPVTKFTTAMV